MNNFCEKTFIVSEGVHGSSYTNGNIYEGGTPEVYRTGAWESTPTGSGAGPGVDIFYWNRSRSRSE